MKYRLTALYADGATPLGYAEYPVFAVDRTIVIRLPETTLKDVDMEMVHRQAQESFPDRSVLVTSSSVEFLVLTTIDDDTASVSLEGASWAMEWT